MSRAAATHFGAKRRLLVNRIYIIVRAGIPRPHHERHLPFTVSLVCSVSAAGHSVAAGYPQNSHFRVARTREVLGTRRWWWLRVDAGHKAKSMPLCACVCVCVGMEFVYTYTQCIHTQVCVCVCVCVCIYVCVVYTQNTESGATACINSRPSTSTSAATSHGYSITTANGTLMFLRWPRVLMNSMKLDETWRMKPPPRQCVSGVSHMYTWLASPPPHPIQRKLRIR